MVTRYISDINHESLTKTTPIDRQWQWGIRHVIGTSNHWYDLYKWDDVEKTWRDNGAVNYFEDAIKWMLGQEVEILC